MPIGLSARADDYTVYLGTLSVATKRDCEACLAGEGLLSPKTLRP